MICLQQHPAALLICYGTRRYRIPASYFAAGTFIQTPNSSYPSSSLLSSASHTSIFASSSETWTRTSLHQPPNLVSPGAHRERTSPSSVSPTQVQGMSDSLVTHPTIISLIQNPRYSLSSLPPCSSLWPLSLSLLLSHARLHVLQCTSQTFTISNLTPSPGIPHHRSSCRRCSWPLYIQPQTPSDQ